MRYSRVSSRSRRAREASTRSAQEQSVVFSMGAEPLKTHPLCENTGHPHSDYKKVAAVAAAADPPRSKRVRSRC